MIVSTDRDEQLAARIHDLLADARQTVAVAESFTGGLVSAALVGPPGASRTFRGGVIVYATDLKARLAGVSEELLAERGPVDGDVAEQLAIGARERCGADWGLATTGVAGPEPQGGREPGTVWIGVAAGDHAQAHLLELRGDRSEITRAAVSAALSLLMTALEGAR